MSGGRLGTTSGMVAAGGSRLPSFLSAHFIRGSPGTRGAGHMPPSALSFRALLSVAKLS